MNALITGASGLIGRHLAEALEGPVRLRRETPGAAQMASAEVVYHLAGEPVASGRWTAAKKKRIYDSRVLGTRALVDAMEKSSPRPKLLVVASGIGYYGDQGEAEIHEDSSSGRDFLAEVCIAWEREAMRAEKLGVRVVCARLGMVLAKDGGALEKLSKIYKLGMGGPIGSGRQWMPWVHIDDVIGLLLHCVEHEELQGPLNVVSPQPTRNRDFAAALGKALHRPALIRAPRLGLRLVAGEFAESLLYSQRVLPKKAIASGYRFAHAELSSALKASV